MEYIDTGLLALILWALSYKTVKGLINRWLITWRNR